MEVRSLPAPAHVRARHPFLAAAAGIFAATLCAFLAVGAVLPVLPRYVHGPVGAGDVAVGVVVGAFAFAAVVTRPWAGRLADRHGRRPVVVVGLLGMAVAGALLYVPFGVGGLIFARFVLGASEGFVFTGASTWIVDLAPEDRRAQSIGLFGLAIWGGLSAGPLIGVALLDLGSYHAVWAFAVLGPLAGAAIAARQPVAPRAEPDHDEPAPFIPRETVGPGIALALANAGYATMAAFVALRVGSHGAAVFTAFAASVVITRLALGRLPDRLGPRVTAISAACAEAAGLAIIALAGSWVPALLGGIVMGWGFSLLYPSLALVVVERVGEARRGSALGAFTAFFDAGVGLGGPLAGAIAALAGYPAAFWVAAGLAGLAAVISAGVAR
jgi:MFS family permease